MQFSQTNYLKILSYLISTKVLAYIFSVSLSGYPQKRNWRFGIKLNYHYVIQLKKVHL